MPDANHVAITFDQMQRRRLKLPKGTLRLSDGRVLQPIVGYDLRKVATNQVTREGILDSAGWQHRPSSLHIGASIDDTPRWGPLLHVSISYPDHDPTWEEIKLIRALFFPPDMDVMMMLPRVSDYINLSQHCFHLVQAPEAWRLL